MHRICKDREGHRRYFTLVGGGAVTGSYPNSHYSTLKGVSTVKSDQEKLVLEEIDQSKDEIIEFLRQLISFPSVTGDEFEIQNFEVLS